MQLEITGRSLIHADSTYIIAAAVGFSEKDAYWIAAYDEATDLNTFTPRDLNGDPVNPTQLTTADIGGVARTSYPTGGLLHHFLPVKTPGPKVNGLQPDLNDINEVVLSNLRAWALSLNTIKGQSENSSPLCAGGLTTSTGRTACYNEGSLPVPVRGALSILYPVPVIPFTFDTGLQIIYPSQSSPTAEPSVTPVYADNFASYIGPNAANAALGTYMHSLGDRVSHHVCTDLAPIVGPLGGGKGFYADLTNLQCSELFHELRHLYERGVPFNQLEPQDRTTEATLSIVYDELVTFAQKRGILKQGANNQANKAALLNSLITALQIPDAMERMNAVTQAGCSNGITAFPGAPACGTK